MVTIVVSSGALEEADCCFGSCIYEPNCTIAAQIREAVEKS